MPLPAQADEHAEIIMFERGEYISFANCGLPYYIGGEITDKADLTVQTPKGLRSVPGGHKDPERGNH